MASSDDSHKKKRRSASIERLLQESRERVGSDDDEDSTERLSTMSLPEVERNIPQENAEVLDLLRESQQRLQGKASSVNE